MAVTALYVHVPFCAQKCRYCDFDSRSFALCDLDAALDSYFEQLYARLDSFGDAGALAQVRTVYIGGGFGINALYVALGELAVVLVLGTALYFAITARSLDKSVLALG